MASSSTLILSIGVCLIQLLNVVKCLEKPTIEPLRFSPSKPAAGGVVRSYCTVIDGEPPFKISWLFNGKVIEKSTQNVAIKVVDDDGTSVQIRVKDIDVSNIGNYTCVATNSAGFDSHTIQLKFEGPPKWKQTPPAQVDILVGERVTLPCETTGYPLPTTLWFRYKLPPTLITGPSDVDVIRHSTASMNCLAKGYPIPRVLWYRESDGSRDHLNDVKWKVSENGTLTLTKVNVDDSGIYTCEVNNGVGEKLTASATLRVHEPPVIITEFQTVNSKKGQITKIKCSAKGESPIVWEWLKGGKHLQLFHGDRLEATEEVKAAFVTSELVIRDTKTEDASVYECKARNKFGETSGTAELTVLEPPDAPKDIKVTEVGSRFARLTWRAPYSGNSPVIHYKVRYWTNDGKGRRLQEVHVPSEISCQLKNLHPGVKYHVAIVAENSVGSGNPSIPIELTTTEEEPSAPPTDVMVQVMDSTNLKVTWKVPPRDTCNGRLTSYQVGFRQHGVELAYRFELVRVREHKSPELTLSGLQPSTRYDVIVRAINAAGNGPWSPEVSAYTSSGNPPNPPVLRIVSSTSHTLQLEWDVHGLPKPDAVKQFVLEYGKAGKMSEKVHIPGSKRKLLLRGLEGNIRYELRMASYNEHGLSAFSPTVSETTMDFQSEAMTQENEATPFYLRLYFIVPVAVSVTVVVSTLVVAWACVARTRALESASHLLRETPYDYCAKMPLAPQQQQCPPQIPINSATLRPEHHRQLNLEEAYDLPWDMTLGDGNYTRLPNGDGRRSMRGDRRSR